MQAAHTVLSMSGQDYEWFDDIEHGDLHRITDKFWAFKGPLAPNSKLLVEDEIAFPPEHYARIFQEKGVSCVVCLNHDFYDKEAFERAGIRHYDLCFEDMSTPPDHIVEQFLEICKREDAIAVHCRAGLGGPRLLSRVSSVCTPSLLPVALSLAVMLIP